MDRTEVEFLRERGDLTPTAAVLAAFYRDLVGAGFSGDLAGALVRDAAWGLTDRHGLVTSNV